MNSPKLPVVKSLNNVKQRADYTRQFTDKVDNAEEIQAIEQDPTLFPNSSRIYVEGEIHEGLKVPMREIRLSDTEHPNGEIEKNEPVRVYDCSGPWGDPEFNGDVTQGLPALRSKWILDRADVEEHTGREIKPEDNGYLSEEHSERYNQLKKVKNRLKEYPGLKRKPLRAKGSADGQGDWHPITH